MTPLYISTPIGNPGRVECRFAFSPHISPVGQVGSERKVLFKKTSAHCRLEVHVDADQHASHVEEETISAANVVDAIQIARGEKEVNCVWRREAGPSLAPPLSVRTCHPCPSTSLLSIPPDQTSTERRHPPSIAVSGASSYHRCVFCANCQLQTKQPPSSISVTILLHERRSRTQPNLVERQQRPSQARRRHHVRSTRHHRERDAGRERRRALRGRQRCELTPPTRTPKTPPTKKMYLN